MKRIALLVLTFVVGLMAGAGGIVEGFPALLSHKPAPIVESVPFNPLDAVPLSYTNLQSNLGGGGQHYISFGVTFSIMPQALAAQTGSAASGSSTTVMAFVLRVGGVHRDVAPL